MKWVVLITDLDVVWGPFDTEGQALSWVKDECISSDLTVTTKLIDPYEDDYNGN